MLATPATCHNLRGRRQEQLPADHNTCRNSSSRKWVPNFWMKLSTGHEAPNRDP